MLEGEACERGMTAVEEITTDRDRNARKKEKMRKRREGG